MAAGEDVEVAGFEFEDDGAGDAGLFLQGGAGGGPDFFCEALDHGCEFGEGNVLREGVFGGDGLGGAVGDDGAVVDAAGELVETEAVAAEAGFEGGEVFFAEVAYGLDVEVFEIFFGDFAYAGDASDGEGEEEGLRLRRVG